MTRSDSQKTIKILFEHAIEIEFKAAQIYERLSEMFSHVQKVTTFWQGLKDNEILHARTLQDIKKQLTAEQSLLPADPKLWDNISRIQYMLSKDLLGAINNLDDAYELANELEFSEVNTIFKFLAIECLSSSEELKEFVHSLIAQHQKKLLDFSHNYGNRDWRRGINILRI